MSQRTETLLDLGDFVDKMVAQRLSNAFNSRQFTDADVQGIENMYKLARRREVPVQTIEELRKIASAVQTANIVNRVFAKRAGGSRIWSGDLLQPTYMGYKQYSFLDPDLLRKLAAQTDEGAEEFKPVADIGLTKTGRRKKTSDMKHLNWLRQTATKYRSKAVVTEALERLLGPEAANIIYYGVPS